MAGENELKGVGHYLRSARDKGRNLTDVVLIYLGRAKDRYGEDSDEHEEIDDLHLLVLELRCDIEMAEMARARDLIESLEGKQ